jgi:phosphatidylserine/phosphatidylglycerophosphate/cardiolipin synthase-like enzyme
VTPAESDFLDEVITVARTIPRTILDAMCDALETLSPTALSSERQALVNGIVQRKAREALSFLFTVWDTKAPHLPSRSVSWALRAASKADEFRRQWQTLELVWTGPAPLASPLRRTDQALLDLIQNARQSVMIVMFAAYKIPEIVTALTQAIRRGVAVTLIVESAEESGGKTAFETIAAMAGTLTKMAAIYVWPLKKRPRDAGGRYGSLHAKCAVADDSVALISSANLTDYALNLNMELGVLVRGGDVPRQIAAHLRQLIEQGILQLYL